MLDFLNHDSTLFIFLAAVVTTALALLRTAVWWAVEPILQTFGLDARKLISQWAAKHAPAVRRAVAQTRWKLVWLSSLNPRRSGRRFGVLSAIGVVLLVTSGLGVQFWRTHDVNTAMAARSYASQTKAHAGDEVPVFVTAENSGSDPQATTISVSVPFGSTIDVTSVNMVDSWMVDDARQVSSPTLIGASVERAGYGPTYDFDLGSVPGGTSRHLRLTLQVGVDLPAATSIAIHSKVQSQYYRKSHQASSVITVMSPDHEVEPDLEVEMISETTALSVDQVIENKVTVWNNGPTTLSDLYVKIIVNPQGEAVLLPLNEPQPSVMLPSGGVEGTQVDQLTGIGIYVPELKPGERLVISYFVRVLIADIPPIDPDTLDPLIADALPADATIYPSILSQITISTLETGLWVVGGTLAQCACHSLLSE